MAHLSEIARPLEVINVDEQISNFIPIDAGVELILLPYYNSLGEVVNKEAVYEDLKLFINNSDSNSIVAVLTSPIFASAFASSLEGLTDLKLWISLKLEQPIESKTYLNQEHAALLLFARYKHSLEHRITRIGYTYCPVCDKTTKDYGGKKHLYHEFGTMISDVWRDISVNFDSVPSDLIERLRDLFGLDKYKSLRVYNRQNYYKKTTDFPPVSKISDGLETNFGLTSALVNGDCITSLKSIPDNSIEFCFADPPYNVKKKYNNWDDGIDIQEYFEWCDQWLSELARVLKPGRTLAILNLPKWCIRHFKHLNNILEFQDWIVWEGRSLPSKNIVPINYSILCFTKGKPRPLPGMVRSTSSVLEKEATMTLLEGFCLRSNCIKTRNKLKYKDKKFVTNIWWDIHRLMHNSRRVDHPCQLPPNFMYRLIALFTYQEEIILDPFNGAGTTSLCAEIMNRKYFGIEISEYYHNIAAARHKSLADGIDPFGKIKPKNPNVKNSRIGRVDERTYKVSKKTLQLEVKTIATNLGRIPTKEELLTLSKYPNEYFEEYFLNWSEVYAAVRTTGMSEARKNHQSSSSANSKPKLF